MKIMEKLLRKVNKVWNTLPKDVIALKVRPSNNLLYKSETVPIDGLGGYFIDDAPSQSVSTIDSTVFWNGYPTVKSIRGSNGTTGGFTTARGIPVEYGKKYTVSAYIKSSLSSENFSIKITWFDKNGVWVSSDPVITIPVNGTDFTRVVATGTPPANIYFGKIKIQPTSLSGASTWWQAGLMFQQSEGVTEFEFGRGGLTRSKLTVDNSQLTFHDMQYQEGLPIKDSVYLDDFTLDELLAQLDGLGYIAFMTSEAGSYASLKAFRLMEGSNLNLKVPSKNISNGGISNTSSTSVFSTVNTTLQIVENTPFVSKTSLLVTVSTSGSFRGSYNSNSSNKLSVKPANKYTASCYIKKHPSSTSATLRMNIEWKNSSGTILGATYGTYIQLTDEWQRFITTGEAVAGASYATITIYSDSNALAGQKWYINGMQFEEGTEATEWVSGDTYTPVELSIFTSQLWELLYPIARLLRNADYDTDRALEQLRLPNAQGKWLDYWAGFFDIKRLPNETDRNFGKRIFGRLANMKTNNVAIEDLLSYTLDVDVKVNDSSASTFEVLVDPVYMDSITYIKDLVKEVKGAGIDYFVNYFKTYSEDYKSYFKDRNGVEFTDSDVLSGGEIIFPTFEEANFMYDVNNGFTLNEDVLTGFGGYSNLLTNYSSFESLTGTNITTSTGVTTSLDTVEKVYGSKSLKAVANGLYTDQQVTFNEINVLPNTTYTFQFMVKGDIGKSLRYYLASVDSSYAVLAFHGTNVVTLGDWVKYTITFTTPANTVKIRLTTHTVGNSAQTWYLDGLQLQTGDSADEWILGGTTRNFTSEDLFGVRIQESVTMTFEETVTNLLSVNQSNAESGTSGFIINSGVSTLSTDTSEVWQGTSSLKVVTGGSTVAEGMATNPHTPITTGQTYTASVYVKGSGTVHIELCERDGAGTIIAGSPNGGVTASSNITLTNQWQKLTATRLCNAGVFVNLKVVTSTTQAITFWADGFQIEPSDRDKTWVVGGSTNVNVVAKTATL